jgi:hypothetical protein
MSKKITSVINAGVRQKQRTSKMFTVFCSLVLLVTVLMTGCQKDNSTGTAPKSVAIADTTSLVTKQVVAPVNLGTASAYTILTETGISTTGVTAVTGNMGVSPIASTAITGFGLIKDASNEFSKSSLVTGKIFASNYAPPTPSEMTTAVSDMRSAFTAANGRTYPAPIVAKYAGDISGQTLPPGLYKWSTGVLITKVGVTLSGPSNGIWVFQIAKNLTVENSAIVTLKDGAQNKNIFWVVSGKATLGTGVEFNGNILSKTLISLNTGAKVNGRLLAQTAVTLIANTVKP